LKDEAEPRIHAADRLSVDGDTPDVTGTSPATRLSRVDLPQPEGPTIEMNSPPRTSMDTS
jgi:hypothetical protein